MTIQTNPSTQPEYRPQIDGTDRQVGFLFSLADEVLCADLDPATEAKVEGLVVGLDAVDLLAAHVVVRQGDTSPEAVAAANASSLTRDDVRLLIDTLIAARDVVAASTPDPHAPANADEVVAWAATQQSEFHRSVVEQHGKRGRLSERQWAALVRSFDKAQGTGPARLTAEQEEALVGAHRCPETGCVLRVYRGQSRVQTKRHEDGRWEYNGRAILPRLSDATRLTAEEAAAFGHDHGSCVFCARDLNDPVSVEHGYGPVCAENFGLPWG